MERHRPRPLRAGRARVWRRVRAALAVAFRPVADRESAHSRRGRDVFDARADMARYLSALLAQGRQRAWLGAQARHVGVDVPTALPLDPRGARHRARVRARRGGRSPDRRGRPAGLRLPLRDGRGSHRRNGGRRVQQHRRTRCHERGRPLRARPRARRTNWCRSTSRAKSAADSPSLGLAAAAAPASANGITSIASLGYRPSRIAYLHRHTWGIAPAASHHLIPPERRHEYGLATISGGLRCSCIASSRRASSNARRSPTAQRSDRAAHCPAVTGVHRATPPRRRGSTNSNEAFPRRGGSRTR